MRRLLTLILALCFFLFAACEDAKPVLSGTPTPASTPTPLPDAFTAEITAQPLPTDLLGNEISSTDHYWQYLSFGELRIYEYGDGTFLDGLCVNAYPVSLDGVLNIVYRTSDGKICGIGRIHNAAGGTLLETGTNSIYAEISTDINVTEMDFNLEIETPFAPVSETPAP